MINHFKLVNVVCTVMLTSFAFHSSTALCAQLSSSSSLLSLGTFIFDRKAIALNKCEVKDNTIVLRNGECIPKDEGILEKAKRLLKSKTECTATLHPRIWTSTHASGFNCTVTIVKTDSLSALEDQNKSNDVILNLKASDHCNFTRISCSNHGKVVSTQGFAESVGGSISGNSTEDVAAVSPQNEKKPTAPSIHSTILPAIEKYPGAPKAY